jgi:hypothetical protein
MANNPYYVGPQSVSKNPVDYMQAAQMAGQSYMMGQESNGQPIGGLINSGLQGAATGFQIGGVPGAVAGAVLAPAIGGVTANAADNKFVKNLKTDTDFSIDNGTGDPIYDGQAALDAAAKAGKLQKTVDFYSESKSGGPGNAFRYTSGLLSGTKRKAERKLKSLNRSIDQSKADFNTQSQDFENRQTAESEYRRSRNMTNRLYNLYSTQGQQMY